MLACGIPQTILSILSLIVLTAVCFLLTIHNDTPSLLVCIADDMILNYNNTLRVVLKSYYILTMFCLQLHLTINFFFVQSMAQQQERGIRYNHFCDCCGYAFASHKDMIIHRASHSTSAKRTRLSHSSASSGSRNGAKCDMSFRKQKELTENMMDSNMKANDPQKRYECKICGVKFAWHDNLLRHERSHLDDSCLCNLCGASFGSAASVKVHLWKVHNQSGVVDAKAISSSNKVLPGNAKTLKGCSRPLAPTDAKPYHCVTCDQRFQYDFSYNAHMNIHKVNGDSPAADETVSANPKLDPERPFACTQCAEQFRYNFLLTAHIKACHQKFKGSITISQFADLIQRGVVGSNSQEIELSEIAVEEAASNEVEVLDHFSVFPDQDVTIVPMSQLPTSLVDFFFSNSEAAKECMLENEQKETI